MKDQNPELTFDTLKLKKAALVLRAINHPLRQRIIKTVHQKQPVNVTELYKSLKLEQSVTSQHLGILRKAGFVVPSREGRIIYYTVNYERMVELNGLIGDMLQQMNGNGHT